MACLKHTDKIGISYGEIQFDWEIRDFFLQTRIDQETVYESPVFTFAEKPWILSMSFLVPTKTWNLCMRYEKGPAKMRMEFEFSFLKVDGHVEEFSSGSDCLKVGDHYFICGWRHSKLMERKPWLAVKDSLFISFTLKHGTPNSVWKEPPPMKLMKLGTLSNDFKKLLGNTDTCDVTLQVGNRNYNAHKIVLMARSPVFAAMFHHDCSEKQTGMINIPDCDGDSFQLFLEFLYCGILLKGISFSAILHLYTISDKYDVQEIKEFCVKYVERYLTEDNVCDVILFADMYNDKKLSSVAQEFFNENASTIVVTAKWESFFVSNFKLANKFLVEMTSKVKI